MFFQLAVEIAKSRWLFSHQGRHALGAQAQIALSLDHSSPGLALALATVALFSTVRDRSEGPGD